MLIHRSSVLGIELVVTTNSSDCLRAVREMEAGAPGERLAAGTLEIEFVSEGRAWSIAAEGRMLRSGPHADDPAACLQDLVAELVCERLSDFTALPAGLATLSGHRVLFVGDRAESTALLPALLAHGADLHTDHLVLVKDGTCTPFPRRFRMGEGTPPPHGSSAAFLERRVHSSAGREFRFFDPTDSGRPWNLDRGAPSVIVSLNPGGGRPVESSPIPRIAMVQQLLPMVADLARRPERTIRELSALVSACGCFSLRTATPGETATEVLRLLQAPGDGTTLPGSADRKGVAMSNANTGDASSGSTHGPTAAGAEPLAPPPAVSIVIPVYNGLKYTRECLKALRENSTGDFEVIVVDDASTDGTPEYLSTVAGITVVRNGENLGFAGACNAGARRARGRCLLFLNNDTVPQPGWLPPLLEIIGNREKAGVAGSRLLYPGGATVQHAGVCMNEEGLPYHIFRHHAGDAAEVVGERKMPAVTGACLLTPRALFSDVGGFDEGYVNGLEDIDYCLLVRSRGWHVYYAGASVLHHHESVSEGRLDDGRQKSNLLRFRQRWGSVIQPDDPADYIPEDAANAPSRRYDVGPGGLCHGTGALEGPRLACRPGVHAKGHCVYGPGLFVMNAQQLRVNFHLGVGDDAPRDGRAVSLDLYDRRHGKILCHQDVAVSRVRDSPAGLPLTAPVARGQELEFRVYWHGEAEIAFSHLTASFSGIASPTDSGNVRKHPEEEFRE